MTTANDIIETMESMRDEEQRRVLMRFFKTGKGDYGEGDEFLGLKVPQTREVVRNAAGDVPFEEIEKLLYSPLHEVRLCGFLLIAHEMKKALPSRRGDPRERRDEIAEFYLRHARQANNWDLVDVPCRDIIGNWVLHAPERRGELDRLSRSEDMWEQRIAVVSCWSLIREREFDEILRISERLLDHRHDLMHKAVGWMLREVGKRDIETLREFLDRHHNRMHRTTLRYAIEKMDAAERKYWMTLK